MKSKTTEEKINEVLDAFNLGVVTKTELQWLIPLVLQRGDTLTERSLILHMTGVDIDGDEQVERI